MKNLDFEWLTDEFMLYCRSTQLREKSMASYEQVLRLFECWCLEEANITEPGQVLDTTVRHYICNLQECGKYTIYAVENCCITYNPARRRDFSQAVSTTTIDNYIRNLKAFFTSYADTTQTTNPTVKIKQLRNERKAQEYPESGQSYKQVKAMTGTSKNTNTPTHSLGKERHK